MSPIERAARALSILDNKAGNKAAEDGLMWHDYMSQAMAVIDALHEPSPTMSEAGAEIIRHVSPDESLSAYQGDAANVWRMMIDAMRKDLP